MVVPRDLKLPGPIPTRDRIRGFLVQPCGLLTGLIDPELNLRLILLPFLSLSLPSILLLLAILQLLVPIQPSKLFHGLIDIELFHVPLYVEALSIEGLD